MSRFGRLPTFILIGTNRGGTTAVARYLDEHPDVYVSPNKEPTFFCFYGEPMEVTGPVRRCFARDVVTTLPDYHSLFEGVTAERAYGEASTGYLANPAAAPRIRKLIPKVKLMAILRDPIERAFSNHLLFRMHGVERIASFRKAIQAELDGIPIGGNERRWYLSLGRYYSQLKLYYGLFPQEQIRIFLYDDLVEDPGNLMRQMYRYLEVDDGFEPNVSRRYNVSSIPRSELLHRMFHGPGLLRRVLQKACSNRLFGRLIRSVDRANLHSPKLAHEDRAFLIDHFRDEILKLEDLIHRDLSAWLQVERKHTVVVDEWSEDAGSHDGIHEYGNAG